MLNTYQHDFNKHTTKTESQRIRYIWESMTIQLSKENKKFMYGVVYPGARAREYENSLQWLKSSGLLHKVYRITKNSLPLSSYANLSCFKAYLDDVA